jgi:ABC-type multidrug transport system fused ATPase/permease subunit
VEKNISRQSLPRLLRHLWRHITFRRRMQLSFLLMLMILAAFAEVISIGTVLPFLGALTTPERVYGHTFIQPIIETLDIQEPKQLMLPLTVIFVCAAIVSGSLRVILLWMQTRIGQAIGADFSLSIYQRTLYQPYDVHVSQNSSDIIAGITAKANDLVSGTVLPIMTIFISVFIIFAIMSVLLAIAPLISFATLAGFGFIYAFVILITKGQLERDSHIISRSTNQVIKALQEGLGGIRDVLIDGTQKIYCNIYQDADRRLRRAKGNVQIISGSPRYGIEALGMVLIAVMTYSLANKTDGIESAIPILGALALGAQRLLPVAQQIYSSLAHIRAGRAALIDVIDLLNQPISIESDTSMSASCQFQRDITLNRISFRYGPGAPWILNGVHIKIPKGARVGFIGSTGCGKSTLLDIIMGLLTPTQGALEIDDVLLNPTNISTWQAHISHVPQAIFLTDSTIAENIAFGIPLDQIDSGRVREAARKAQIAEVIETWDKKYQTLVGERGVRLSGGQRQRIGIARALYKHADVIIFDEATSALDNETEEAVMDAIENLSDDLTILMIAHRITTLKKCSLIFELGGGGILRTGTYQEIASQ